MKAEKSINELRKGKWELIKNSSVINIRKGQFTNN